MFELLSIKGTTIDKRFPKTNFNLIIKSVGFEVLTAVVMKSSIFLGYNSV
jgi:hypothetical protein